VDYDVAIIGCGRVGLPLALAFADHGLKVIGVDNAADRLAAVRAGRMPFSEPGAQEILDRVDVLWTDDVTEAARARHIVITLGTPTFSHIEIDLSDIRSVLDDLLPVLRDGHSLILRSTIAPRTTEFVAGYLAKHRDFEIGEDVFVAHVPERIAAGRFFEEISTLPCIVGGVGERSGETAGGALRGPRRAGRADDARPGRAREDLDEHPALRHLRAAEPPHDGRRAVRRERLRDHRPHQPRLPPRRDGAARPDGRHVPAQGLRVLRGAVARPGHAPGGLARARVRPAVPRGGHEAAARAR
jgi:hypothetical protein